VEHTFNKRTLRKVHISFFFVGRGATISPNKPVITEENIVYRKKTRKILKISVKIDFHFLKLLRSSNFAFDFRHSTLLV
jgi:hypothetical protein